MKLDPLTFLRLRAEMLNPNEDKLPDMRREVREAILELPAGAVRNKDTPSQMTWYNCLDRVLGYRKPEPDIRIWAMRPEWEFPMPKLPETDGDLYNPYTRAALFNPDEIAWDYAPKSWKRDFQAAVELGATWDFRSDAVEFDAEFPHSGTFNFESTRRDRGNVRVYRLDPSWTPPPKMETNGDLNDPDTLAKLYNPDEIVWTKLPKSWQRDFEAAVQAGAKWDFKSAMVNFNAEFSMGVRDNRFYAERGPRRIYRLDPSWKLTPKVTYRDVEVTEDEDHDLVFKHPYDGQTCVLSGAVDVAGFMGYIYPGGVYFGIQTKRSDDPEQREVEPPTHVRFHIKE